MRGAYRFREHTLAPDSRPEAEPTTSALECKTCGERGESSEEPEEVFRWAADHLKKFPGHLTYRKHITVDYHFEPGDWL